MTWDFAMISRLSRPSCVGRGAGSSRSSSIIVVVVALGRTLLMT